MFYSEHMHTERALGPNAAAVYCGGDNFSRALADRRHQTVLVYRRHRVVERAPIQRRVVGVLRRHLGTQRKLLADVLALADNYFALAVAEYNLFYSEHMHTERALGPNAAAVYCGGDNFSRALADRRHQTVLVYRRHRVVERAPIQRRVVGVERIYLRAQRKRLAQILAVFNYEPVLRLAQLYVADADNIHRNFADVVNAAAVTCRRGYTCHALAGTRDVAVSVDRGDVFVRRIPLKVRFVDIQRLKSRAQLEALADIIAGRYFYMLLFGVDRNALYAHNAHAERALGKGAAAVGGCRGNDAAALAGRRHRAVFGHCGDALVGARPDQRGAVDRSRRRCSLEHKLLANALAGGYLQFTLAVAERNLAQTRHTDAELATIRGGAAVGGCRGNNATALAGRRHRAVFGHCGDALVGARPDERSILGVFRRKFCAQRQRLAYLLAGADYYLCRRRAQLERREPHHRYIYRGAGKYLAGVGGDCGDIRRTLADRRHQSVCVYCDDSLVVRIPFKRAVVRPSGQCRGAQLQRFTEALAGGDNYLLAVGTERYLLHHSGRDAQRAAVKQTAAVGGARGYYRLAVALTGKRTVFVDRHDIFVAGSPNQRGIVRVGRRHGRRQTQRLAHLVAGGNFDKRAVLAERERTQQPRVHAQLAAVGSAAAVGRRGGYYGFAVCDAGNYAVFVNSRDAGVRTRPQHTAVVDVFRTQRRRQRQCLAHLVAGGDFDKRTVHIQFQAVGAYIANLQRAAVVLFVGVCGHGVNHRRAFSARRNDALGVDARYRLVLRAPVDSRVVHAGRQIRRGKFQCLAQLFAGAYLNNGLVFAQSDVAHAHIADCQVTDSLGAAAVGSGDDYVRFALTDRAYQTGRVDRCHQFAAGLPVQLAVVRVQRRRHGVQPRAFAQLLTAADVYSQLCGLQLYALQAHQTNAHRTACCGAAAVSRAANYHRVALGARRDDAARIDFGNFGAFAVPFQRRLVSALRRDACQQRQLFAEALFFRNVNICRVVVKSYFFNARIMHLHGALSRNRGVVVAADGYYRNSLSYRRNSSVGGYFGNGRVAALPVQQRIVGVLRQ